MRLSLRQSVDCDRLGITIRAHNVLRLRSRGSEQEAVGKPAGETDRSAGNTQGQPRDGDGKWTAGGGD
jgi:hypothetical protein